MLVNELFMKKWIYVVFVCIAGLLAAQACAFPWQSSLKAVSVTISHNNGTVAPDYYEEGIMNVSPDYELRTISVDYNMTRPLKKEKTESDTFKGDAIIGGEYFDKFEDVVDMVNNYSADTKEEPCVGGSTFVVALKMTDGKESLISVFSCGESGENVDAGLIDDFYSGIIDLLTKNVY